MSAPVRGLCEGLLLLAAGVGLVGLLSASGGCVAEQDPPADVPVADAPACGPTLVHSQASHIAAVVLCDRLASCGHTDLETCLASVSGQLTATDPISGSRLDACVTDLSHRTCDDVSWPPTCDF